MIHIGQRSHPLDHHFERKAGFPYWTLAMMTTGSSRHRVGTTEIHKVAPCITLIPPNTAYDVVFGGRGKTWRELWTIFSPPPAVKVLAEHLLDENQSTRYLSLSREGAHILSTQFKLLFSLEQLGNSESEPMIMHGVEGILLTLRNLIGDKVDARLRKAAIKLTSHLDREITLDEVAQHAGMSPSSLSHSFRDHFACPPMRYRENHRLKQAASLLLSTNLPLKEIAAQLGFADPYHFSRRFRKYTGQSPSQYRNPGASK